jgi:CheY-like chemotaxis protein
VLVRFLIVPTHAIEGFPIDALSIGQVYDIDRDQAAVLVVHGWAEIVSDEREAPARRDPRRDSPHIPLVLVVDDDAALRHLTEALLIAHGYDVVVACHGHDAMQRLRERCPSLIVLDLNMPVMDGWQFRHEQRYLPDRTRAVVPVVVLTAAADAVIDTDRLQAVALLKKPFDPDDLLDVVSAAIGTAGRGPDGIGSTRPRTRRAP